MADINGAEFNTKNKTREQAGADERSPSKAQYFSWINNTNEGSTEEQTLINLEYFRWLRDEYGMQLDIYAWDAGNLDGAGGTYESFDSPKLKAQYPNGYERIGKAAKEIDVKLGVWCGPDGFGDTPEEEGSLARVIEGMLLTNHETVELVDGEKIDAAGFISAEKLPEATRESLMQEVQAGFDMYRNTIADKMFGKPVSELTEDEVNALNEAIPFQFTPAEEIAEE